MTNTKAVSATHGDIKATCTRYGFGKTTAYELLRDKKIRAKKLGAKTLIEFASVDEYLANLPAFGEVC
ncbi:helix-turn-helix domain-containing protein [Novosphingobium jiangmenense]|uniref:Helix-turn-helix domain-containing protein n=1 Tax=Novosphingobium jiangmenense TaxID=2791981 RepID=A0ABS0HHB9_9SPHN|nr:helix-turn-helix domain-containing protein [Novosphingobium jiangmenense]MBF9151653.1 helix-turn-helix domain-containing protein [Novosphingobium jiangmenense]